MPAKVWKGSKPVFCELCGRSPKSWFVDGRLRSSEAWGTLCGECWAEKGVGSLGIGNGQKYDATTLELLDGDFLTAEDEAFILQLDEIHRADEKNRPN